MLKSDIPSVLAMNGAEDDDYPWSEEDFYSIIKEKSCLGKVLKAENEPIAYTVCLMDDNEINILKLCVKTEKRRQGVATEIINQYKHKVRNLNKFDKITSVVKEKNLDGQLFLKQSGFICTDIISKYFEDFSDGYQFSWTKP